MPFASEKLVAGQLGGVPVQRGHRRSVEPRSAELLGQLIAIKLDESLGGQPCGGAQEPGVPCTKVLAGRSPHMWSRSYRSRRNDSGCMCWFAHACGELAQVYYDVPRCGSAPTDWTTLV